MENIELKLQQMTLPIANRNINRTDKSKDYIIAQYDLNGYIIKVYSNMKDIKRDGFEPKQVKLCINGQQKTHRNFIFKKINIGKTPQLKISVLNHRPTVLNKQNTNNIISNVLNNMENKNTGIKIPTGLKRCGIGSFLKNGTLVDIFLNFEDIIKNPNYTVGIYDHLFNRVSPKTKRKGYKNKYYFRKLNPGETYYIGDKYNLKSFTEVYQTKYMTNRKKKQHTTVEESIYKPSFPKRSFSDSKNITVGTPTRIGFWQRIKFLFTGKFNS
jgi:hypothetical protein